jgi:predicted AlkP superfamily phosphohydrolase/phosphomutase
LKQCPQQETKLTEDLIDWEKTYVWSEGGYYARIFMNVKGRELHGIIELSEYERFRDRLRDEIASINDSNGERLENVVLKPEELYRTINGIAPDLIVYFDSLNKRSIGNVGVKELLIKGEGLGLDACNHSPEGIFIATRLRDLRQGVRKDIFMSSQACRDITPTILAEYGVKVPAEMPGKVISLDRDNTAVMFSEKKADPVSFEVSKFSHEDRGFTAEEEEIVRKRLSDLGYI